MFASDSLPNSAVNMQNYEYVYWAASFHHIRFETDDGGRFGTILYTPASDQWIPLMPTDGVTQYFSEEEGNNLSYKD